MKKYATISIPLEVKKF